MSKKVVAVLFGGRSTEHDVSKRSAATIMAAMSDEKYRILPIYITKAGKWMLFEGAIENMYNSQALTGDQWEKFGTPVVFSPDTTQKGILRLVGEKFKLIPVDIVFPVLHGANGEDGRIQGLCELAGIPYVGCNLLSSAACMDKAFTKIVVSALKIAQADHVLCLRHEIENNLAEACKRVRYKIGYPCFVKPANAGSSVGVSKAADKKELEAALLLAARYDRKVLVEKAIVGRELECAVLGNTDATASVVGEVLAAADFYDYEAKYHNAESQSVIPADIPPDKAEEIRGAALAIYKALDCSGFSRVDFFLENGTNKVIFNEINTIPGFTTISMYPKLWNAAAIDTDMLVDKLITLAVERADEDANATSREAAE